MVQQRYHVCFVSPYIEGYLEPGSQTHVGGAERQQSLLARHLRNGGHSVSFIAFETDGTRRERIDGFDVLRTLPRTNDPLHAPATFAKLLRSIRCVDADVFYVRGNPPLCILASACCSLLDESHLYVVANDSNVELARLPSHHDLLRYTVAKLAYLDAVRRADRVVAQTDYQRDLLSDAFGVDSTVVPNGYALPPEDEIVPATERTSVLWVGSLDPDQKRPVRYLRLAERLPDVDFRLVGWTDDVEYRKRIADRAAATPNLTFEGFVPPDEIDRYYRRAVALVNTSEYEGFPNTFLEAWRYAVPVVSWRHTLDGVLEAEEVGYKAGTMEELVGTVADLWSRREQAAETGRRGRYYMANEYAMEAVVDRYDRIFRDLVA